MDLLLTIWFFKGHPQEGFLEEDDKDAMEKPPLEEQCMFNRCPRVKIMESEFEEWCAPWKGSLVVHVLGKSVGFKMLEYKLQRSWPKVGKFRIVDMPVGYYLVQFTSEEGYKNAMYYSEYRLMYLYSLQSKIFSYMRRGCSKQNKVGVQKGLHLICFQCGTYGHKAA
uniref:DUF4283 domain-containing protein n=1 Tax=Glycine max TaxID=3847 RepID=K7KWX8_SOYBN